MLTVSEFCERYRICRRTFYRLLANGDGPRVVKVGKRSTRISEAAAAEWLTARESTPAACL
ncbi:transcriptional regulator, AlpA family [Bradyrhizobium shewense]|uniref:Transcriptional regulator, AlpA family n=1 Tax=Bradyrhizobium shewense TaxID=1761772 RepID=A0A1C3WCQ7_9BRAD|nr:helix-turn-helix domain-containing protein [Bradyrhizobium shewense]SCB37691.1 transcriptional regulator, AlpA family [Bradyrhizobium shewense]